MNTLINWSKSESPESPLSASLLNKHNKKHMNKIFFTLVNSQNSIIKYNEDWCNLLISLCNIWDHRDIDKNIIGENSLFSIHCDDNSCGCKIYSKLSVSDELVRLLDTSGYSHKLWRFHPVNKDMLAMQCTDTD